jgi:hypothetical protein
VENYMLYVAAIRPIDVLKIPACYDNWLNIRGIDAKTEVAPRPQCRTVAA